MAIDDLSSQRALHQLGMEELHRAPAVASSLPGTVMKAISALLQGDLTQAADLLTQCQGTLESKRSEYLLLCIIDDLKWLRDQVHSLTQKQQEYLSTDWVALLLDADKKARATRANTRIARIAKILSSSIQIEPTPSADETEEMMRIATELSDDDVLVLQKLREVFDRYLNLPSDAIHTLLLPDVPGITPDSVLGICGKLQSLGLVAAAEQRAKARKQLGYPPGGGLVPLERAEAFLKFIADQDNKQ